MLLLLQFLLLLVFFAIDLACLFALLIWLSYLAANNVRLCNGLSPNKLANA